MRRRPVGLLALAAVLALGPAACSSRARPPAPTPLAPAADATLPQDNLWDECTIYGLGWEFAWSAVAGAKRYALHVEREGSPAPYAQVVVATPATRVGRCGCLPDDMLNGWRWRVRAGGEAEEWSAWSDWRSFAVAPLAVCGYGGQEH